MIAFDIPFAFGPVLGLSWAVIYWGLCCLAGLGFASANIRTALRQMRQVDPEHDEAGLRVVALTTLLGQSVMGFVLVACLGLGVLAALTPPSPGKPVHSTTVWLVYVFDLLVTAITAHAVLLWLGQRLALNRIREARTQGGVAR